MFCLRCVCAMPPPAPRLGDIYGEHATPIRKPHALRKRQDDQGRHDPCFHATTSPKAGKRGSYRNKAGEPDILIIIKLGGRHDSIHVCIKRSKPIILLFLSWGVGVVRFQGGTGGGVEGRMDTYIYIGGCCVARLKVARAVEWECVSGGG